MRRPVIDSEDGARADLGPARTQPAWLAAVRTLPFTSLSPDEFEVLGYLLLRREHPNERVFYYGKTGDGGRDILRPQSPRGYELIQCKRYEKNVGIDEIRQELAKLYSNVFHEVIPDRPERVTFYVSRDLTAPAKDLLRDQSRWIEAAEGALREHLRREPDPKLLEHSRTWWPDFGWQSEIELTERVKRQPELRADRERLLLVATALEWPRAAYCYFSIQAVRLPDEIRAFIDSLEGAEGEDGDAVRQGREHREPENGWSEWSFPVLDLGEELKKIEAGRAASGEAVP